MHVTGTLRCKTIDRVYEQDVFSIYTVAYEQRFLIGRGTLEISDHGTICA